jgi:hypothetical protein
MEARRAGGVSPTSNRWWGAGVLKVESVGFSLGCVEL